MGSHNLEDYKALRRFAKSDMFAFIENIPKAINSMVNSIKNMEYSLNAYKYIVYCGMGGSAIAGDLAIDLLMRKLTIPMFCVRNYELPSFVGGDTLVVGISYSGNTEETISCINHALAKGSQIITVSSGGRLAAMAEGKWPHILVPSGYPPRSAIAYLLTSTLLGPLKGTEPFDDMCSDLINLADSRNLNAWIKRLMPECPESDNPAKALATQIKGRVPVIYSSPDLATVAYRWATQFHENSKVLAFSGVVPEMNHNALVGWYGDNEKRKEMHPILLYSTSTHPRIKTRIEFLRNKFNAMKLEYSDYIFDEKDYIDLIFKCMLLGDATSIYLAYLRGVDPYPVDIITELKSYLAGR